MIEQEILTKNGPWKILKNKDEICIVDPEGRERHRSKGHLMTAMHLAMMLSKNPLIPEPNADEALRLSAENFINDYRVV